MTMEKYTAVNLPGELHIDSKKERADKYRHLDVLGKIIIDVFDDLCRQLEKGLSDSDEGRTPKIDINIGRLKGAALASKDLSTEQRVLINRVFDDLEADNKEILQFLKIKKAEGVKKYVSKVATELNNEDNFEVSLVPGGILVLTEGNRKIEELGGHGYYLKQSDPSQFGIILLNTGSKDYAKTLRHEYFHLINHRFLESNEPETYISKTAKEISDEIKEIEEEVELGDNRRQLQLKKRKIELAKVVDSSDYYSSPSAIRLFRDMRDEMCAYALEDRIELNEEYLVPAGTTFQQCLSGISYLPDRTKFINQWMKLKDLLRKVKEKILKDRGKELLPIFLTSQNFAVIMDRIREKCSL